MGQETAGDVTQLLVAWSEGNEAALARLMPLVYEELHHLASSHLRRERADHTLQTAELVHEAYLRLVDQKRAGCYKRGHFFAVAAQAMRRVLVDHARKHLATRRNRGIRNLSLDQALTVSAERAPELVALDGALDSLASIDGQQAKIVELRFFGGLNSEEIGHLLGISVPTVTRAWRMARAWLYRNLKEGDGGEP